MIAIAAALRALAERGIYKLDREVARNAVAGAASAAELKLILDYLAIHLCPSEVGSLLAHLKRILKLDRLRLRGMSGARDEFLLAATAQNLLKMARLLSRPPPVPGVIAPA